MKKALAAFLLLMGLGFTEIQQTPQVLHYGFTVQETDLILTSLSKLPYEQSAELIFKIRDTATKQLTKK